MSDSDFESDAGAHDDGSDFEPDAGADDVSEGLGSVYEESDEEDFAPPAKKARKSKKAASKKPAAKSKQKAAKSPASDKSPASSVKSGRGRKTVASPASTTSKKSGASKSRANSGAGAPKAKGKSKGAAVKSIKEKDAPAVLLDYINKQNKPYSAVNIFDNLHKAVKRAHVNRVLDKLAAQGKIKMKMYKKFKLYFPDQAQYGDITQESVSKLEEEKKAAEAHHKDIAARRRAAEHQLNALQASPTDDDLAARIAELQAAVDSKKARLAALQSSGVTVSPEAKNKLIQQFKKYRKAWSERRTKVMDMVERMSEGMDKKPKAVIELLGLETDEEYGVSLKATKIG